MSRRRQPAPSLPTMSGNFDFPPASSPASSSPTSSAANTATAAAVDPASTARTRLQHLRSALRQERERERADRDAAAAYRQASSPFRPRLNRRMRTRRDSSSLMNDPASSSPSSASASRRMTMLPSPSPPPPPPLPQPRPRATPGERFQTLRRQRQQREQASSATVRSSFDDGEHLAQVDSELASILGPNAFALPPPQHDAMTSSYYHHHHQPMAEPDSRHRQRRKRRKLDHDGDAFFSGFKYGHFGQVVPGRLKMDLVSCDGGDFEEDNMALYRAENILKNDKSVYCTKSNRCNILLKHQGETTFCLEKLVIKAPERGFTAPVQEGMVFVSMAKEGLISGTSRYQIHYNDASSRSSSSRSSMSQDNEQLTLLESLHDPEIMAAATQPRDDTIYLGTEEPSSLPNDDEDPGSPHSAVFTRFVLPRRRMQAAAYFRQQQLASADPGSENCDWPFAEGEMPARDVAAPTPPPITITTETDNGSSDEEASSSAILADRERRDRRWRSEWDSAGDWSLPNIMTRRSDARHHYLYSVQRSTQSRIEAKESSPEDDEPILEPHARFFIEKNRSKVTIKFDPPVSGRYMLLKLWSPALDANIDIQTVATYGYAGPRYFPSCEVR